MNLQINIFGLDLQKHNFIIQGNELRMTYRSNLIMTLISLGKKYKWTYGTCKKNKYVLDNVNSFLSIYVQSEYLGKNMTKWNFKRR